MAFDPSSRDGHAFDGATDRFGAGLASDYVDADHLWEGVLAVLARDRLLWALAAAAMVLDIALTGIGLSLGLREQNPIALAVIESLGLVGAGVVMKGGAALLAYVCWRLLPEGHRGIVPLGLAIPSWAAVAINSVTILSVL